MMPEINDPIDYAMRVVGGDPFASYLGIEIEEVKEAYARVSLKVKPEYMNSVDRAHGGMVYMLIDQALAVAANSRGIPAFTMNINVNYHSGAPGGTTVVAEAKPVDLKRKISVWEVEARTREDWKLIASAVATAYHKS